MLRLRREVARVVRPLERLRGALLAHRHGARQLQQVRHCLRAFLQGPDFRIARLLVAAERLGHLVVARALRQVVDDDAHVLVGVDARVLDAPARERAVDAALGRHALIVLEAHPLNDREERPLRRLHAVVGERQPVAQLLPRAFRAREMAEDAALAHPVAVVPDARLCAADVKVDVPRAGRVARRHRVAPAAVRLSHADHRIRPRRAVLRPDDRPAVRAHGRRLGRGGERAHERAEAFRRARRRRLQRVERTRQQGRNLGRARLQLQGRRAVARREQCGGPLGEAARARRVEVARELVLVAAAVVVHGIVEEHAREVGVRHLLDRIEPQIRLPKRIIGVARKHVRHQVRPLRKLRRPRREARAVRRAALPRREGAVESARVVDQPAVERRAREIDRVAADRLALPADPGQRGEDRPHVGERRLPAAFGAGAVDVRVRERAERRAAEERAVAAAPVEERTHRNDPHPDALHRLGLVAVAARAELVQHGFVSKGLRRPGVRREEAEREGIRVARLRPEDEALAERVVLHEPLARLDDRVVRAHVERALVGEEHRIGVGELADDAPLREVVAAERLQLGTVVARRVPFVVPDDVTRRVEFLQQRPDLVGIPRVVEVPAGDEVLRVRIFAMGAVKELLQRRDLEAEVVRTVREAPPLAEAGRVEKLLLVAALSIRLDRRLRQLPVGVGPAVVPDVPDEAVRLRIALRRLRQERRPHLLQKRAGRARIPVGHRAEVLGDHQAPVERILLHVPAKAAAVVKRPEERAVVEPLARVGRRLRGIRVGHDVRVGALEKIVLPDAQHEDVEPPLEAPVDLARPLLGPPVLGLEAREAPVREIADAAVLEVGFLLHIEAGEVDRVLLRHDVDVPEPAAAAAPFQEVVETVPDAPHVRADDLRARAVGRDRVGIPAGGGHRRIDGERDEPVGGRLPGDLLVVARELRRRQGKRSGQHQQRSNHVSCPFLKRVKLFRARRMTSAPARAKSASEASDARMPKSPFRPPRSPEPSAPRTFPPHPKKPTAAAR